MSSYSTVFGIFSGKFDRIAFQIQWNRSQGSKFRKKSFKVGVKNPRVAVGNHLFVKDAKVLRGQASVWPEAKIVQAPADMKFEVTDARHYIW